MSPATAIADQLPDFIPGNGAMLFNSFEYLLVFLPVSVIIYFLLNYRVGALAGKLWLIAASLFFYAWWSLSYLWLISGSILFNFCMARLLERLNGSKAGAVLTIAITGNLIFLGYYKYADFFIGNINHFLDAPVPLLHIVLPLAISFFTIQQIAYLVDVYEGVVVEKSFIDYSLFVTFFPHLLAGPILHHKEMMPQFSRRETHIVDWQNLYTGLFILSIGLLKKVLLAESLATASNTGFNSTTPLAFHDAWITSLSYSMQIYFDFSGYTDMAIGAALLFNIRLPENFNSPFKAVNLQDYWKRWHMTLTRFITSYIYTPLVRSTPGAATFPKSMAATLFAMFIAGLWHGASWHFVLFGTLHGAGLVISHTWRRFKMKMPGWLACTITFLFVNAALVIFRADNMTMAIGVLKGMVGLHGFAPMADIKMLAVGMFDCDAWSPFNDAAHFPARRLLVLLPCLALAWCFPNTSQLVKAYANTQSVIRSICLVTVVAGPAIFYTLFMTSGIASFIYFYF